MSRKVALITGAASGIGQALAVAYARVGVAVVGGYYPADPHDPQSTVALVEQAGGACLMLALDVGDTASVDALAAQAVQHFGRLDYAVANAGLLRRAPLLEMTDALWAYA
jgi:3-oxoacyl-[acyl-carrier protein] reductase